MTLRDRLLAYIERLEEPVFRIALYEGPEVQGRHEGEDTERLRVAGELRRLLAEDQP